MYLLEMTYFGVSFRDILATYAIAFVMWYVVMVIMFSNDDDESETRREFRSKVKVLASLFVAAAAPPVFLFSVSASTLAVFALLGVLLIPAGIYGWANRRTLEMY